MLIFDGSFSGFESRTPSKFLDDAPQGLTRFKNFATLRRFAPQFRGRGNNKTDVHKGQTSEIGSPQITIFWFKKVNLRPVKTLP